jgi:hypothetical protein
MTWFEDSDIDFDYLANTIARAKQGLELVTPGVKVVEYIDTDLTPPFWWIYIGELRPDEKASDLTEQNWVLAYRYVVAQNSAGLTGQNQRKMYVALPKTLSFFRAHLNMLFAEDDAEIPYLDTDRVSIEQATEFGLFAGEGHLGIELRHFLPFTIEINQEFY